MGQVKIQTNSKNQTQKKIYQKKKKNLSHKKKKNKKNLFPTSFYNFLIQINLIVKRYMKNLSKLFFFLKIFSFFIFIFLNLSFKV